MEIELTLGNSYIDYLRTKFKIDNEEDLIMAIFEMMETYMEL